MAVLPDRAAAVVGRWVTDKPRQPVLSIVVPILNEAEALPAFFEALKPWRQYVQLILADGGSTDESETLAKGHCDHWLQAPRGRAAQMNAGARLATGRYILFLHCDTRIACDFPVFVEQVDGLSWGFCRVQLSGNDWRLRIVEWAMNLRARLTSVATGDQALIFAAETFSALGGYADIPLMEDVEICKRARRYSVPAVLPATVVTSSRRWEERGVYATILMMWRLRFAYWMGKSPEAIARSYYG